MTDPNNNNNHYYVLNSTKWFLWWQYEKCMDVFVDRKDARRESSRMWRLGLPNSVTVTDTPPSGCRIWQKGEMWKAICEALDDELSG